MNEKPRKQRYRRIPVFGCQLVTILGLCWTIVGLAGAVLSTWDARDRLVLAAFYHIPGAMVVCVGIALWFREEAIERFVQDINDLEGARRNLVSAHEQETLILEDEYRQKVDCLQQEIEDLKNRHRQEIQATQVEYENLVQYLEHEIEDRRRKHEQEIENLKDVHEEELRFTAAKLQREVEALKAKRQRENRDLQDEIEYVKYRHEQELQITAHGSDSKVSQKEMLLYGDQEATPSSQPLDIDSLDGHRFELVAASLLQKMGLEVEQTKRTADGGIDVIARSDKSITGGTFAVQCKRYSSKVGVKPVRELYGVVSHVGASKGILITNSVFPLC